MKPLIWTILTLVFLTVSPAFGNYNQMKQDLNGYEPPDVFFAQQAEPPAAGTVNFPNKLPEGLTKLAALKPRFEKKLAAMGQDRLDPDAYEHIKTIAGDEAALTRLLGRRVAMNEIKAVALLRNPQIKAAGEKVQAEIQTLDQVTNLDDQLRQYSAFTRAVNPKAGPVKEKDAIKMAFPSPGLTALKGKVVENGVLRQIEKAAVTYKTVLRDVETVFWDLVFIDRSIQITRDTIDAFVRLRDVATVLYRSGKTSFQDVIKIKIKLEELKETLVTLASKKRTVSIRLFELLNLPRAVTGKIQPYSLPPDLPIEGQLYGEARAHRQELKALRFQIEKVTSMVEMAETMTEARSTLGFSFNDAGLVNTTGTDAPKAAFATRTMAAMKNNSPVKAWYSIQEPWLQQTRKTLASLKNTLQAQENATDRMVRRAWFKADKDKREHLLYKKKILPLAKSALNVATREYESGSIPFSQAIGSYTYWLKVQLTIAKKNSDYGSSFAQLEFIIGKPLR